MGWGQPRADDDPYWAEKGLVWIEYAPGRKRLVDPSKLPPPQPEPAFPAPTIIRDTFAAPLQSMADGKTYDSKSALYRTYRADGNPQGIEYECVGDKPIEPFSRPTPTKEFEAQKDAAISRALDEAGY